jgi:hypothetical protein
VECIHNSRVPVLGGTTPRCRPARSSAISSLPGPPAGGEEEGADCPPRLYVGAFPTSLAIFGAAASTPPLAPSPSPFNLLFSVRLLTGMTGAVCWSSIW